MNNGYFGGFSNNGHFGFIANKRSGYELMTYFDPEKRSYWLSFGVREFWGQNAR